MTMNRKILNDNDIERIRKNVSVINHDELVKICFEMITKNLDADEVDLVVDMLWDYSTDLFFKSKYREFIDFSIPFKKLTEKGTSIFCKSVELDVAGIICYLTEDDDKAAELMNDLYIHSVKHGLKVSEIKSQLNLTGWYLDHNRLDDALVSLQRVEGMDGNTLFTKSFLYNMYYLFKARINIVQMELQEFNENIEKLDMSSNARFPDNIIFEMYELRAKYCVLNNDYTGAFAMYTKAIEFAEERNIKKEVLKVYKDISNLYLENKQFEKSILYLNKYIELSADLNESHRKLASQKAELETEMAVLKAKNELIKSQRDSDYLTGLFNRGYFTEFLEQRFAQYCNAGETFSLMIIDLDDFKGINDTYGHTFGDEILIRFSRIVQDNLLPNHIFARTGGDEFMICFPNEAVNELEQIIEMIITTVNDCELQSIGFSGGIVDTECLKFESYKSMIEKADEKLYIAKRNGKNYVEY